MTVLVDSWAWIEYFKSTPVGIDEVASVLERSREDVIVSAINIAEVYNAFLRDYPGKDKFAKDSRAAIKQRSYVFDMDEEIAVESARIKHKLKWGLGDSIILATAKREGAKVMTGDPHFKGVKDVIYLGK